MEVWRAFENNILRHSEIYQIPIVKIPEKMLFIKGAPVRKKTAFDFCASVGGLAMFFDAKCVSDKHMFNLKSNVFHHAKIHQWSYLTKFQDGGAICGYLIWFVSLGKIVWANVDSIKSALSREEKSITVDTLGVIVRDDVDPIDLREFTKADRELWITKNIHSKN